MVCSFPNFTALFDSDIRDEIVRCLIRPRLGLVFTLHRHYTEQGEGLVTGSLDHPWASWIQYHKCLFVLKIESDWAQRAESSGVQHNKPLSVAAHLSRQEALLHSTAHTATGYSPNLWSSLFLGIFPGSWSGPLPVSLGPGWLSLDSGQLSVTFSIFSVGDLALPPILILTLLPVPVSFLVITISLSSTLAPLTSAAELLFLLPALGRVLLPWKAENPFCGLWACNLKQWDCKT